MVHLIFAWHKFTSKKRFNFQGFDRIFCHIANYVKYHISTIFPYMSKTDLKCPLEKPFEFPMVNVIDRFFSDILNYFKYHFGTYWQYIHLYKTNLKCRPEIKFEFTRMSEIDKIFCFIFNYVPCYIGKYWQYVHYVPNWHKVSPWKNPTQSLTPTLSIRVSIITVEWVWDSEQVLAE